jgi:hypothetical protein
MVYGAIKRIGPLADRLLCSTRGPQGAGEVRRRGGPIDVEGPIGTIHTMGGVDGAHFLLYLVSIYKGSYYERIT